MRISILAVLVQFSARPCAACPRAIPEAVPSPNAFSANQRVPGIANGAAAVMPEKRAVILPVKGFAASGVFAANRATDRGVGVAVSFPTPLLPVVKAL